jgi:hypothetical protein
VRVAEREHDFARTPVLLSAGQRVAVLVQSVGGPRQHRLFTPTGKAVTTSRTVKLRLPARHKKHRNY